MSAFDIAGAVVFGLLSATGWRDLSKYQQDWKPAFRLFALALVLLFTGVCIFCIARLFGAHT